MKFWRPRISPVPWLCADAREDASALLNADRRQRKLSVAAAGADASAWQRGALCCEDAAACSAYCGGEGAEVFRAVRDAR